MRRLNGIVAESDRGSLSLSFSAPYLPFLPPPELRARQPRYAISLHVLSMLLRNRAIPVKVFAPLPNPLEFVLSNSIRLIRKDFGPQFGIILSSPTVHACPRFFARVTDPSNYAYYPIFSLLSFSLSLFFGQLGSNLLRLIAGDNFP